MIIRLLILLLVSSVFVYAQPQVAVHDTSVKRGASVRIPIYVSLSAGEQDTIHIHIKYKRYALALTGFEPDNKSAVRIDTNQVLYPTDSSAVLQLTIYPVGGTLINKPLLYLYFEALAYKDSITSIEPVLLMINSRSLSETIYTTAKISFPDAPPVQTVEREFLAGNYPNPFSSLTHFTYNLIDRSDVEFTLFNLRGSRIAYYRIENQTSGRHVFDLPTLPYEVSSGIYHLRMVTKNGVYIQQCTVEK